MSRDSCARCPELRHPRLHPQPAPGSGGAMRRGPNVHEPVAPPPDRRRPVLGDAPGSGRRAASGCCRSGAASCPTARVDEAEGTCPHAGSGGPARSRLTPGRGPTRRDASPGGAAAASRARPRSRSSRGAAVQARTMVSTPLGQIPRPDAESPRERLARLSRTRTSTPTGLDKFDQARSVYPGSGPLRPARTVLHPEPASCFLGVTTGPAGTR
jgi:hypothetical protein